MTASQAQTVWVEQCRAAMAIKERFGLQSAFDYLVAEKLMNFADAAREHPEFARELPSFVAEVRRIFSWQELDEHLSRMARELERAGRLKVPTMRTQTTSPTRPRSSKRARSDSTG